MSKGALVVEKVIDMRAEPGDSWGEQHGRALGIGSICGPFV